MTNHNTTLNDICNKQSDIVDYILATESISELCNAKIEKVYQYNSVETKCTWQRLPAEFKGKNNKNFGCA